MTNRDNAMEILRFGKPERVVRGMPSYELAYFGANHESFDGTTDNCPVGTKWTDIWGIGWEKEQEGIMGYPRHCPLAEIDALKSYQWPDPDDDRICSRIYEQLKNYAKGDVFLSGSHRNLLFEKANKLVGMENLMVYFLTEPEFVREVFRRITDFQVGIQKHYLKCGVEIINCSEDLGGQRTPLISPAIVREFMLPEYKRLLEPYRERGVVLRLHSCGSVGMLLDVFFDMGINILNPIQATANNMDEIRRLTQGRIALEGGVNSAVVMSGPCEAIRAEVKKRIRQLGEYGGYFCSSDQHLPFPEAHVRALADAVDEFGHYPII